MSRVILCSLLALLGACGEAITTTTTDASDAARQWPHTCAPTHAGEPRECLPADGGAE